MFLCSELPEIGALSFVKEVINEGDSAQSSCIVTPGDQPLTISWSFHGQTGVCPGRGRQWDQHRQPSLQVSSCSLQ